MKKILLLTSLTFTAIGFAQDNYWRNQNLAKTERENADRRLKDIQNSNKKNTSSSTGSWDGVAKNIVDMLEGKKKKNSTNNDYYYDDYEEEQKPTLNTSSLPLDKKYHTKYNHNSRTTYNGQMLYNDGIENGQGKLEYDNGSYFEGFFKNGYPAEGTYYFKNGTTWKIKRESKDVVYGIINYKTGESHTGYFSYNKNKNVYEANGYGYFVDKDGSSSEGLYKDDIRNGFIKVIYKTDGESVKKGDRFEGYYKNNERNGRGIYYHADGKIDDGYYLKHKFYGKNPPPGMPETIFFDELKEGLLPFEHYKAQRTMQDGEYLGIMKDEKRSGNGVLKTPSGDIYEGIWEDNQLIDGKKENPNNDTKFYGSFKNLQYHGYGKLFQNDSTPVKEGYWFKGSYIGNDKAKFDRKNSK